MVHAAHPGVDAYNKQIFDKAKDEFETALAKTPDNGKINYNLGNTYFKLGDPQRSIKAYEEAIPMLNESDKTNAFYNLGTVYLNKNDFKQALAAYREVLKRDPDHLKAKQNLEWALRQQEMPPQESSTNQNNNNQDNHDDNDAADDNQEQTADNNNDAIDTDKNQNNQIDQEQSSQNMEQENDEELNQDQQKTQELSEEQIEYLVNNAEKEARERRKVKQAGLFEGGQW